VLPSPRGRPSELNTTTIKDRARSIMASSPPIPSDRTATCLLPVAIPYPHQALLLPVQWRAQLAHCVKSLFPESVLNLPWHPVAHSLSHSPFVIMPAKTKAMRPLQICLHVHALATKSKDSRESRNEMRRATVCEVGVKQETPCGCCPSTVP